MADISKTVEIVFGGKDEISRKITDIEKNLSGFGQGVVSVAEPLAGVADGVLKLDAALAAMVIGGMALAVKKAGEFGGAFGEITTLLSDTGPPIEKFKNDILAYSLSSVKGIDDINQAIYSAISAGVDYKDSLDFVKASEQLAVAGRADLGATTKALISVLNAYGESTDKAGKYSDLMFTTVKLGQTTLEELSQSLSMVTGLAANTGVPFETLSAAIAALTVSGMPTSQAITSIKAALTNIIKPTKDASDMAKILGIEFNAAELKSKGFDGILKELWTTTQGDTEKMAAFFGSVEALNGVLVLGADKTGKFSASISEMGKAGGSAAEAYKKVADEFDNINQRLVNSFMATLISVGERLETAYGDVAGGLGDVFKGVKIAVDQGAFDDFFEMINQVGVKITERLAIIAKNLPEAMEGLDFSGLLKALSGLGEEIGGVFGTIFGEIDLDSAEGLHEVLQKIINGFAGLVNVTKGIVEGMKPLFEILGKLVENFSSMDAKTQEVIGQVLGVGKAITVLADNSGALIAVLGVLTAGQLVNAAKGFAGLASSITGAALPALGSFGTAAAAALPALGSFGTAAAALGGVGIAAGVGYMTGSLLNQIPVVGQAAQAILSLVDVNDDFFGASGRTKEQIDEVNRKYDEAVLKSQEMAAAQGAVGAKMSDSAKRFLTFADVLDNVNEGLKTIPEEKDITVKIYPDRKSVNDADWFIKQTFPDGRVLITNVGAAADPVSIAGTKKKIDKDLPDKKIMEIEAKIETEKLKAQADIIQTAIEWKAKLDLAEAEADMNKFKSIVESISGTIESTGGLMGDLFGELNESQGKGTASLLERMIAEENKRREAALELQKDLTEATIEQMKARTRALTSGQALIEIDGAGLQPHLEAFMFEILEAIQIRANHEGAEFLLGL